MISIKNGTSGGTSQVHYAGSTVRHRSHKVLTQLLYFYHKDCFHSGVHNVVINIIFKHLFVALSFVCIIGCSIIDDCPFIPQLNVRKNMCTAGCLIVCALLVFIIFESVMVDIHKKII